MVEHQPSKLDMWVRFPSPASTKRPQVEPEGFFIEQARPRPQGSGLACRVFVSLRSSQIRHPLDVVRRSVRGLRSTGARSLRSASVGAGQTSTGRLAPHHLLSQYLVINQVKRLFFSCKFYRAVGGQWPDLKAKCLVYKLGMPCLPRTIKIHK